MRRIWIDQKFIRHFVVVGVAVVIVRESRGKIDDYINE